MDKFKKYIILKVGQIFKILYKDKDLAKFYTKLIKVI